MTEKQWTIELEETERFSELYLRLLSVADNVENDRGSVKNQTQEKEEVNDDNESTKAPTEMNGELDNDDNGNGGKRSARRQLKFSKLEWTKFDGDLKNWLWTPPLGLLLQLFLTPTARRQLNFRN